MGSMVQHSKYIVKKGNKLSFLTAKLMISSCETPMVKRTLAALLDTLPRSLANPNVGLLQSISTSRISSKFQKVKTIYQSLLIARYLVSSVSRSVWLLVNCGRTTVSSAICQLSCTMC